MAPALSGSAYVVSTGDAAAAAEIASAWKMAASGSAGYVEAIFAIASRYATTRVR